MQRQSKVLRLTLSMVLERVRKGNTQKRGREIGRKREIQTEKKRGKVRKRKEEITEKMSEMLMCEKERK